MEKGGKHDEQRLVQHVKCRRWACVPAAEAHRNGDLVNLVIHQAAAFSRKLGTSTCEGIEFSRVQKAQEQPRRHSKSIEDR